MTRSRLSTDFNLGSLGDDVYAALIAAHRGLSDADSQRLNARLVLILMNHVGNAIVVQEAIAAARQGLAPGESRNSGTE